MIESLAKPLRALASLLGIPITVVDGAIGDVLALLRREPRVDLPDTGVSLVPGSEDEASPVAVAEAIIARSTVDVAATTLDDGGVELSADAVTGSPVLIAFADGPEGARQVVVHVGPWTVTSADGADHRQGDAAVAMAAAFLGHGLEHRRIKDVPVGLLWLEDALLWWRPNADGGGPFRQTFFDELPGEPASAAEHAQRLAAEEATRGA